MRMSPSHPSGQLLLAGGGHTHALVLLRWLMARKRPPGAITLVNRHSTALYSGMVPGLVAGFYDRDACSIDLRRLCREAGVTFIAAEITGLNLAKHLLLLADRPPLHWDWLSLDVGSTTGTVPKGALGVKPLEPFLNWLPPAAGQHAAPGGSTQAAVELPWGTTLTIRGGGAAAVELALALGGRGYATELLLRSDNLHLGSPAANQLGESLLRQAGIPVRRRAAAAAPTTLACTGSRAPAWLAAAGLPCDQDGRVLTLSTLQVEGHSRIFAVGDCGVLSCAPRPASGVWAVRSAPILATNLARCLASSQAVSRSGGTAATRLRQWRPQRRALQLLADGSQPQNPRAIAVWGPVALGPAALLWHWKNQIDQRFMARFARSRAMAAEQPMACRGCAAKLAAAALTAGLAQSGLNRPPEDAAVVAELAGGELLLQSVDGFPAIVDDPWLNARLTALHACSDLWACGAQVSSAQAVVTLPEASERLQQEWLAQTLAGLRSVLDPMGAPLMGGHSLEGRDGAGLAVSLSVNGRVAPGLHWPKGPLQAGQSLILTRRLGSGVLFAAAMAGAARAGWLDQALAQMQQSQGELVPLLHQMGCQACTDITGFGLLGHLGEMLDCSPSTLQVELDAAALIPLPGVFELLEQGYASSLAPANATALGLLGHRVHVTAHHNGTTNPGAIAIQGLLIDPQTCGPLLAAIPTTATATCLDQLNRHGFGDARCIGRVIEQGPASGLGEWGWRAPSA